MGLQRYWNSIAGPLSVFRALWQGLFIGSIIFSTSAIAALAVSRLATASIVAVLSQGAVSALLAFPLFRFIALAQMSAQFESRWPWPVTSAVALAAGLGFWAVAPALIGTFAFGEWGLPYALGVASAAAAVWLLQRRRSEGADNRRTLKRWAWISVGLYVGLVAAFTIYWFVKVR